MNGLVSEIESIVNQISDVVKMFYQQNTKEAYQKLDGILGDLMGVVDQIHRYQTEHPECGIDMGDLMEALKETLSAMEEKDAILTADVLKYEVNEKLQMIMDAMN